MKKYLEPKIIVVEFKVENGLQISGERGRVLPETIDRPIVAGMSSEIFDRGYVDISDQSGDGGGTLERITNSYTGEF